MAKGRDWSRLEHAYGNAEDVPSLIAQLSPDGSAEVWDELWSRICHQGTVYSASFPVLPYLLAAALKWPPSGRVMPLALAGGIVASKDVQGSRTELIAEHSDTVQQLGFLAEETVTATDLSRIDRVYLLQAKLAFSGDRTWGNLLHGLADGEFGGECTHCNADLYLVIGEEGFFATAEEWVNRPQCKRSALTKCASDDLPNVGACLFSKCLDAGDTELGEWVCHLFGSTTCPRCEASIGVADSIVGNAAS